MQTFTQLVMTICGASLLFTVGHAERNTKKQIFCYSCYFHISQHPDFTDFIDGYKGKGYGACVDPVRYKGVAQVPCNTACFTRHAADGHILRECYSGNFGVDYDVQGCGIQQRANWCFCNTTNCNTHIPMADCPKPGISNMDPKCIYVPGITNITKPVTYNQDSNGSQSKDVPPKPDNNDNGHATNKTKPPATADKTKDEDQMEMNQVMENEDMGKNKMEHEDMGKKKMKNEEMEKKKEKAVVEKVIEMAKNMAKNSPPPKSTLSKMNLTTTPLTTEDTSPTSTTPSTTTPSTTTTSTAPPDMDSFEQNLIENKMAADELDGRITMASLGLEVEASSRKMAESELARQEEALDVQEALEMYDLLEYEFQNKNGGSCRCACTKF